MLERVGSNVTLDQIFEDLYNLINEANRIPLTDKIIVEETDLSTILEDLKEAIPKEVKNAGKVLEESKNIMASAREEATAIVEKANTEAEHIVTAAKEEADRRLRQEEIVQQADKLSKDIKASAQRYEDEVKQEADDYADRIRTDSLQYADDMLGYLSTQLQSALDAITSNRKNINEERTNLEATVSSRVRRAASEETAGAGEQDVLPEEEEIDELR